METEIELKFFVKDKFVTMLRNKILDLKVLQHNSKRLGNIYFETEDNWLRQHDIGLRIRTYNDVFVQTVKTAGRVVAGLHQRPEFNAEHTSTIPDLSLHPDDIWPKGRSIQDLQQQIKPLFSTDFTREQWLISMADGSQIEVAFDQGEVISGDKSEPICEVELELRSGQIDALFTLARFLSDEGGMRLGNLSKAARGYYLAQGKPVIAPRHLSLVNTSSSDTVETCFINSLEHALDHWHRHEQLFFEGQEVGALYEIQNAIRFIRQTLLIYGDIVPRKASAILRQEMKWLDGELTWLKEHFYLSDLLKDKGYILRKLDAQKTLVERLKEQKNKLPTAQDIQILFSSARYTGLLLDLSRWILLRGWQPFMGKKAQQSLSQSVLVFSRDQLDNTWQDLSDAFPPEKIFDREGYIQEANRLMRNLYTGIGFANLYNVEERNRFRLPWSDLLEGIDDLNTLSPLEALCDDLESSHRVQLLRWIKRQEISILHAMEQTRIISIEVEPYWR
ncbi:inorganic triphosphatase [Vibrio sp.]|nr:inorganic triphosphatase [Vibrio sp.]